MPMKTPPKTHEGRVALVTGAAQGIGVALAERGAQVIATDLTAPNETVLKIGPTAHAFQLDVTQKRTENGATPLLIAAAKGHREIVALLLDHGADVKPTTTNGWTALHVAAIAGDREIVALLLQQGADKTAKDTKGLRPIDRARQQGHSTLVALLEP